MPKRKSSKKQRLEQANKDHEQWLKSMGYKGGKSLKGKHGRRMGIYELPNLREGLEIKSKTSDKIAGNGNQKKSQTYTGDYIKGITTTHKSNLMPVTSREQAVEASQMRRN